MQTHRTTKTHRNHHATWAVADNDRNLPQIEGRKTQSYALWNFDGEGGRYFAAFPPFHVSSCPVILEIANHCSAGRIRGSGSPPYLFHNRDGGLRSRR